MCEYKKLKIIGSCSFCKSPLVKKDLFITVRLQRPDKLLNNKHICKSCQIAEEDNFSIIDGIVYVNGPLDLKSELPEIPVDF